MRLARSTLLLASAMALPAIAGCNEFHVIPSCTDGITNGSEGDTDCGGDACPRCALGRRCRDQPDCIAGDCVGGFCTPAEVGVWELRSTSLPNARFGHAMSDDGTGTLMFGGADGFGGVFWDTWRWDGQSWAALSPPSFPSGRHASSLAHDVTHLRAVLFGGIDINGNAIDDTWSWDTKSWTNVTPPKAPPTRVLSAITYDPDHGVFVLFGGVANSADFGDTWTWQGGVWQMAGAAGPPSRHSGSMTYDEARKQAVLFGGTVGSSMNLDDTWTWDGVAWSNASPDAGASAGPSGRRSAAITYDRARGRVILFGGSGDAVYGDLWEWDGSTWRSPVAKNGPQGRFASAMAYDPTRRRVVLFGGTPDGTTPLDDTWEYHQRGNPCQSDAACDTSHCVDGLCCESEKCGACETCNNPTNPGVCTMSCICTDAGACAP